MKKVKKALLVDDSKATNFFNKKILERTGQIEEICTVENGEEALKLLKEGNIPEIIFLDINMPVMNGWEFLSAYQELNINEHNTVIILMLGAALSQEDIDRAKRFIQVKGFQEKMLTKTNVNSIIEKHIEPLIFNKEALDFNS